MAGPRRFQLDELTIRPGTYFNPQTEVLLVVDDSPEVDHEAFGAEDFEESEWVLVSDDSPLDEHRRDELVEQFLLAQHPGGDALEEGLPESEELDEEDELEGHDLSELEEE